MPVTVALIVICLLSAVACSHGAKEHFQQEAESDARQITDERAIAIARADAGRAHLPLDSYDAFAADEREFWHVIFVPKNQRPNAVEHVYLIFKANGQILEKGTRHVANPNPVGKINRETALSIAKKDAIESHEHLENYEVFAVDEREFWHVIFTLKNGLDGGGPDYLIDKQDGKISEKRLYQ